MRLIADGVVEREGVPGLAARLGYSSRHLTRLLTAELGAGPLALSRAHRAHTARMLLVGTDLPAADVAFSAGFASVRQFNDTVREVFGMPPLELRAGAGVAAATRGAAPRRPGAIDLVLPHRGPLDAAGLFAWMRGARRRRASRSRPTRRSPARCGSPAVRRGSSSASTRSAACGCGRASPTSATCRPSSPARGASSTSMPIRSPSTRRWRGIRNSRRSSPRVPGIRVPGAADPHEMLIRAMVGQQITVAAARTALTALTATLGEPVDGFDGDHAALPDDGGDRRARPRGAARSGRAHPRAHRRRGAPSPTARCALTTGDDGAEQRAALLAMPGIGPWTADYVRMRVLGDPDVFLPGDVAVRAGAAAAGIPSDAAALTAWAARTAPWRSYLTAHLWRACRPCRIRIGRGTARPAATPPSASAAAARSAGARHHRPKETS